MLQRLKLEPFGLNLGSGEGRNCVFGLSRKKGLKIRQKKRRLKENLFPSGPACWRRWCASFEMTHWTLLHYCSGKATKSKSPPSNWFCFNQKTNEIPITFNTKCHTLKKNYYKIVKLK